MQGTHSNSSFFFSVNDVKVAETATSFLAFWALFCIMTFLLAGVALNVAQVFGLVLVLLCYLNCIDPSGWMTLPISMTLVFHRNLGLKLISGRRQMGLSLFFILGSLIAVLLIGVVLVFLDQRPMSFWAPGVDFPNHEMWLKASFCFCINSFLQHFFPHVQVLSSIIYLSLDR